MVFHDPLPDAGKANPSRWGEGVKDKRSQGWFFLLLPTSPSTSRASSQHLPRAGSPDLGSTSPAHLEDANGRLQGSVL